MAVASLDGFNQNPGKVWAWHSEMRNLFANAGPNGGHEAIALLEAVLQPAQVKVKVITQNIDGFHRAAEEADVFFTVGTSGIVQPTASLAGLASDNGAMVIEVNPGATPQSVIADYAVRASATEFFQSLCRALKAMKQRQLR